MKTIAKENIPGRREFKQRFNRKLGGTAKLFDPISEQLAEEAERVVMEVWLSDTETEPAENVVYVNRKGFKSYSRHYCSNCGTQNIYPNHSYCPTCGTRIVWTK
jgi:predicted RNA-binding Zn-ribbon protein involved in translation (DUF1610 family)